MTKDEWARIAALIDGLWKDEFDKTREASYFMVLAPYEAIDVYAAVIAWTDEPRPFGPSIGELKSKLRISVDPADAPSYESAITSMREVAQRCGVNGEEQGIRSLELEHPFLGAFARKLGWSFIYYRGAQNEDYSRTVYKVALEECTARRESYAGSLAAAPVFLGLPQGAPR